jgi:beta-glucanase (GH16 family)
MGEPVGVVRRLIVGAVVVGAVVVGAAGLAPPSLLAPGETASAVRVQRDECGPALAKPGGGAWRCSFVDTFRGRSLDRSHWIVQDTARTGFRVGRTCYKDSPDTIAVRRGVLVLSALKGPARLCGVVHPFLSPYSGGMVGTKGKFSQTFGRFEIRAKMPTATHIGIHGGFWMNPVRLKYGKWPASGEIDVAEWWSEKSTEVLPSLHYNGRKKARDSGLECGVADATVFHTYTVVWQRKVMHFLIDGEQCFVRRWKPDAPQVAPQPFDHPFSMILNMGVARRIAPQTEFPARFVVDYAKAWR